MVNATAGSTVLGSYDPLDALADVCEKHSVWLHADGAWGGAVLLSDKLRDKMKGIERCVASPSPPLPPSHTHTTPLRTL